MMDYVILLWLYFVGVAIVHDEWALRYRPQNLKIRRLYMWLPTIKYKAKMKNKRKQDAK
jgi:hypothetical protein